MGFSSQFKIALYHTTPSILNQYVISSISKPKTIIVIENILRPGHIHDIHGRMMMRQRPSFHLTDTIVPKYSTILRISIRMQIGHMCTEVCRPLHLLRKSINPNVYLEGRMKNVLYRYIMFECPNSPPDPKPTDVDINDDMHICPTHIAKN